jgi:hypothetical protein
MSENDQGVPPFKGEPPVVVDGQREPPVVDDALQRLGKREQSSVDFPAKRAKLFHEQPNQVMPEEIPNLVEIPAEKIGGEFFRVISFQNGF